MATPVGPVDRDPNDPDNWDFGDDEDELEEPTAVRYPMRAMLAAGSRPRPRGDGDRQRPVAPRSDSGTVWSGRLQVFDLEQVRRDETVVGAPSILRKVLPADNRPAADAGATSTAAGEVLDCVVPHGVIEGDFLADGDEAAGNQVGRAAVVHANAAVRVTGVVDLRPQTGELDVLRPTHLRGVRVVPPGPARNGSDHDGFSGPEAPGGEHPLTRAVRAASQLVTVWLHGTASPLSHLDLRSWPTLVPHQATFAPSSNGTLATRVVTASSTAALPERGRRSGGPVKLRSLDDPRPRSSDHAEADCVGRSTTRWTAFSPTRAPSTGSSASA